MQLVSLIFFLLITLVGMMAYPNTWALYQIIGYYHPGRMFYPNPGRE